MFFFEANILFCFRPESYDALNCLQTQNGNELWPKEMPPRILSLCSAFQSDPDENKLRNTFK